MAVETDQYEYVLYVDEAGDDGLQRVKPSHPNGASEWLCLSGVLIRRRYESDVVEWVRHIRKDINATQGPDLHYRKLSPTKRRRACELMAERPLRAFVVASNKKNMQGYQNMRAAKRGAKQWFYNWLLRLLLERVTHFVAARSTVDFGEIRPMRVVFSQRGGHSYGQTKAYLEVLKAQASGRTTHLQKREIIPAALRFNLVDYIPHAEEAGLQLADVAASAFFQAMELSPKGVLTGPAEALKPVVASENGIRLDYGLTLQPMPPERACLTAEQQAIFKFYGFDFGG
jgi:hypothetical protein